MRPTHSWSLSIRLRSAGLPCRLGMSQVPSDQKATWEARKLRLAEQRAKLAGLQQVSLCTLPSADTKSSSEQGSHIHESNLPHGVEWQLDQLMQQQKQGDQGYHCLGVDGCIAGSALSDLAALHTRQSPGLRCHVCCC